MTSGKHSRQRRQARSVPRPPGASGRRASPKVLAGAGAVLVAVVVVVVLVVTLTGGKKTPKPITVTADLSSVSGIHQTGLQLGNPLARVALMEYVDTSCPICRDYVTGTFPSLSSRYVRTGKVKVDVRLVSFVGPSSPRGRDLVLAASRQNKAWQLLELLYQNQGDETKDWLTDDVVRAIAVKIPGLDVTRLLHDATSDPVAAEAVQMDAEMQADGVSGTPTFFLTTRDGKRHFLTTGNASADAFAAKFDEALSS